MTAVATPADDRVPVTVLTGFLGSGKTTLLNRILTEAHGKRIAVIENEFGEIGIDHELVVGADEEIFEMNNGCICCTVRGDLIRILPTLLRRKDKFDYILIETTGMADPGPVAQTFFVDDEMQSKLRLDGIVTLVDAKHISDRLTESNEAREQIAFADVILVNKSDLVEPDEIDAVEARIRAMNGAARIFRTRDAKIELDSILDIGGFDLSRAQTVHPKFLEPEYPFEWSGVYELQQGPAEIVLGPGPDATMKAFLQPISGLAQPDVEVVLRDVTLRFSQDRANVSPGRTAEVGSLAQLELDPGGATYSVSIPNGGPYAVFTEHRGLDEYALRVRQSGTEVPLAYSHVYKPDHVHDTSVSSVGISDPRPVDPDRFNAWLRELVAASGKDIFRMKGVLNVKGHDRRWVFQGVHMLVTGSADREWGEGERRNTMIFIGRNLDREQLNAGFFSCIAEPA